MTAIIGFHIDGQPVMVGDLLLTAPRSPSPIVVPTVGDVQPLYPTGAEYAPVGLVQKIAVLSSHFALAWSGNQMFARMVIRQLRERFQDRTPTGAELIAFFEQQPQEVADDLTVIAMGTESDDQMYLMGFFAEHETHPTFGFVSAGGRGGSALREFLRSVQTFHENEARSLTPFAKAMACSLTMLGQFVANEIVTNRPLLEYYGGGYEVLIWTHGRWHKVGDILTLVWVARQTAIGRIELVPRPIRVIRQSYAGDLLVIRTLTLEPDRADEENTFIVDAADRPSYDWERRAVIPPEFRSSWICHQFVVGRLDGAVSPRSRVTFQPDLDRAPLQVHWDGRHCTVDVPPDYLNVLREFASAP